MPRARCRDEIQDKLLEKIEMCLDCEVFASNIDQDSARETLNLVGEHLSGFRKMVEERDKEWAETSMELAMGLSEVFEALRKISLGDPLVRIDGSSQLELISKLKEMVNQTAENLGETVQLSHEFAIGLAEHFDTLHRVSRGDLAARVRGRSEVELLESLKHVTNQTIESVSSEINERKRAEKALRESMATLQRTQTKLVESEKMAALGNLVAGVAHEINTPVGVSITAASYLAERTTEFTRVYASGEMRRSDLEKFLQTVSDGASAILSNVEHAAKLIRSFKQVAVDRSTEERRRFRLKDYLHGVLLSLRPKYKGGGHAMRINCPEDLVVDSYPGAFSQVITNLVMNSLTHGFENMDRGEIAFDISVDKDQLVVRYSDNGKGMDQETVKKIYDPFFTTKRGRGSDGLGLHMVYNLVTQTLGGQIACGSSPNEGTTFFIEVPLTPGDE
jgi:signal transduction histidine kinase